MSFKPTFKYLTEDPNPVYCQNGVLFNIIMLPKETLKNEVLHDLLKDVQDTGKYYLAIRTEFVEIKSKEVSTSFETEIMYIQDKSNDKFVKLCPNVHIKKTLYGNIPTYTIIMDFELVLENLQKLKIY